jgi:uncharacterized protein YndB with AHSA1/START domain
MTMSSDANQEFVMSRDFEAPRSLVFDCFTLPEHMRHWWGPKGSVIVKMETDLRVGGRSHYGMKAPDGKIMYGRFVYREIVRPERIVFVNSFSDEAGGLTRHPLSDSWPLETLSTFLFEDIPVGRTRFTLKWTPWNATVSERATFAAGHASMTGGWTGSLEQLDAYMTGLRKT